MIQRMLEHIELLRAVCFYLKESSASLYQSLACLVMSALIPLHVPVLAGMIVDTMKAEQVILEHQYSTISMLNFFFDGPGTVVDDHRFAQWVGGVSVQDVAYLYQ